MSTLASRVKSQVDKVHRGNVNRAAKEIGIPQPTLDRIVKGEVSSPRIQVLRAIAEFYQAPLEWLLTGEGPGPEDFDDFDPDMPWAELLRWSAFVDSLAEPGPIRDALFRLPFSVQLAHSAHLNPDLSAESLAEEYNYGTYRPAERLALKHAILSWLALLRGWSEHVPRDRLNEWLHSWLNAMRLGYNPVAMKLYRDGVITSGHLTNATDEPPLEGSLVERMQRLRKEDEELQRSIAEAMAKGFVVISPPRSRRRPTSPSEPKKRRAK